MTLYPITMDYINSRTEYTFWSLWSSPLLVSTDIRHLSPQKRSILMNEVRARITRTMRTMHTPKPCNAHTLRLVLRWDVHTLCGWCCGVMRDV